MGPARLDSQTFWPHLLLQTQGPLALEVKEYVCVDLPGLSARHLLLFLLGQRFWASSPTGSHSGNCALPGTSVLREGSLHYWTQLEHGDGEVSRARTSGHLQ